MQNSLSSPARSLHAGICIPNTPFHRTLWAALCIWCQRLGCHRPWQTQILPLLGTQHRPVAISAATNSVQEIGSPRLGVGMVQRAGFRSSPFVELQCSCCPGGGEPAQQSWILCAARLCSISVVEMLRRAWWAPDPSSFTHPLWSLHLLSLPGDGSAG